MLNPYGNVFSVSRGEIVRAATAADLYRGLRAGWDGWEIEGHGRCVVRGGLHQLEVCALADMAGEGWVYVDGEDGPAVLSPCGRVSVASDGRGRWFARRVKGEFLGQFGRRYTLEQIDLAFAEAEAEVALCVLS